MITTFSHSALESYRSCPKKFQFEYDSDIDTPDRTTADAFLGSAVHTALKRLYDAVGDGVVLPLNNILERYHRQWGGDAKKIEVVNENMAVGDYIVLGEKMLRTHYEHYAPFDQGVQIGSEMALTFELPGALIGFKARIDRLWKRKDGVVEICDYKTGKTMASAMDPSFWYQMGIYQLSVQARYPQFTDVELCQYYLRHDEVVRHRMSSEDLDELVEQLRIEVLEVRRATRLNDFPTREGGQCLYCDFRKYCPAKRHAMILAGEAEVVAGVEKTTLESANATAAKFVEIDARFKEVKAEHEALKADLVQASKDLGMNKFVAGDATIAVSVKAEEVFITKSNDQEKFGELASIVRGMGLDQCFTLDAGLLMKDVVLKERVTPQQLETLRQFMISRESARVTARRKKGAEEE